jgi:hypothetical protein
VIRVAVQQVIRNRLGHPARSLASRRPVEEDRGPPRNLSLKPRKLRTNPTIGKAAVIARESTANRER